MASFPPTRLTEAFIRGLPFSEKGYRVRDTRVVGLMVAVNKASKSYKVQRDLWTGQRGRRKLEKTVRHTLGSVEEMTLEEARIRAEQLITLIKTGVDPNAQPASPEDGSHAWKVERMYKEYTLDLRTRERSERTGEDMLSRLNR